MLLMTTRMSEHLSSEVFYKQLVFTAGVLDKPLEMD